MDLIEENTERKPIGVNKIRVGKSLLDLKKRIDSSFGGKFDNSVSVIVDDGITEEDRQAIIGNIDELYETLESRVTDGDSFETKVKAVYDIVTDYFGPSGDNKERLKNYKPEYEIFRNTERGKVSDLKGKNTAMCSERAMVSQNLLKHLGINSFFKASIVIIQDGGVNYSQPQRHAYNLIEYDGKYYIFDSSLPMTLENGEKTPIVAEISKEAFEEMIKPDEKKAFQVKVTHDNRNTKVLYNYWDEKAQDGTLIKQQEDAFSR